MIFRIASLLALLTLMGCGGGSVGTADNSDDLVDQPDEVYARPAIDSTKRGSQQDKTPKSKTENKTSSTKSSSPPESKNGKKDELVYRGQSLSQWKKMARDLDPKYRAPAIEALSVIGQHKPDPEILSILTQIANENSTVKSATTRLTAVLGLTQIAARFSNSKVYVTLFRLLKSPNRKVRSVASAAIAKLQNCWSLPESLRETPTAVASSDRLESTVAALVLLSQSQEDARRALKALTRLYSAPAKGNRQADTLGDDRRDEAMESLGKGFSNAYLRSIPHVLSLLTEKESDITVTAMLVLGASLSLEKPSTIHDKHVKQAVKLMLAALNSSSTEIRSTAATVLGEIRSTNSKVGMELFNKMRYDMSATVRGAAAHALGQLADVHEQIVPALLSLVRDTNASGRELAISTLGNVLAAEHPGTRDVLFAVRDSDPDVRAAAIAAIENIGIAQNRLVATLEFALQDNHRQVRRQAAAALGRLGQKAKRALSSMQRALDQESDRATREVLISSMQSVAGKRQPANQQARNPREQKRR